MDLDLDGDLDIVYHEKFSSLVLWLENDGSPTDGGWVSHPTDDAFTLAQWIAVSDIDRDGDPDVVGLSPDSSLKVTVWWENDGTPGDNTVDDGNGNYWTEHGIASGTSIFGEMSLADIDGDGDIDLAGGRVPVSAGELSWWENDGTPVGDSLWTVHTVPSVLPITVSLIEPEDFDRDGDVDLLAQASNGDFTLFRNDAGDGSTWTV